MIHNCRKRTDMNIKNFGIILFLFFATFAISAQSKAQFGHIDYGEVIRLIPGVDTAQTALEAFTKEFQDEGEILASEFRKMQEQFENLTNDPNTSPNILKIKQDELQTLYKRIEDFSEMMQIEVQNKQIELLKPFQEQLTEAIAVVAKAENIIYVFDISTLLYHKDGKDIAQQVKKVLGINDAQ